MSRDLGVLRPGSTFYHFFDSYDGGTGASLIISAFALADIKVYKNGGVTERASTAGFTLLDTDGIDFDSNVGINGFSIDLSDNTTAAFWQAGNSYTVVIGPITVDGQTVNFVACHFRIGYEGALIDTKILTLTSQTIFQISVGSSDADAYVGCLVIIHDLASSSQIALGYCSAYAVFSREITLAIDPAIFTMAFNDNVSIMPRVDIGAISGDLTAADNLESAADNYSAARGLAGTALPNFAADLAGGLAISDLGGHDLDVVASDLNDIQTRLPAALVGGRMDSDVAIIQATAAKTVRDEILPTQNAVLNDITFLFVAASDHVTPVTGATTMTVTRSIDGGAFAAGSNSVAEIGNGIYVYDASASDMNGGEIVFRFAATGGTPGAPDDAFVSIRTTGGV